MTQHPPQARVGPLYVPGETGCFACQERAYRRAYPLYEALERSEQLVAPSATFGPACGLVGVLAANDVIAHLTGIHRPATLGRALIFDLTSFAVEWEAVPRDGDCPVCA
jgi:bacteriocin biosynthesis cyclodehydratase domain-containing protein